MCLAGAEQTVNHGGILGGIVVAGEQVILSADGYWTDAVFYSVVIRVEQVGLCIQGQLVPAFEALGQGCSYRTFGQDLLIGGYHPVLQFIQ